MATRDEEDDAWGEFIRDYNIDHRKGSKKWRYEIRCPFCKNDPSYRMGLKTGGSSFGCLVDKRHGGAQPYRLIQAVLGVTQEKARVISAQYFKWTAKYIAPVEEGGIKSVDPPTEFLKFEVQPNKLLASMQKRFAKYLKDRGMDPVWVSRRYDLRWCIEGKYQNRVIVPITEQGLWYTWVARDIEKSWLRYLASTTGNPPAKYLFDQDNLRGGETLIVCEGSFDAMKVASCFIPGVDATALFGKQVSDEQLAMLITLSDLYDTILLCLDRDAIHDSLKILNQISLYTDNVRIISPSGKDPGSMDSAVLKEELSSNIQHYRR